MVRLETLFRVLLDVPDSGIDKSNNTLRSVTSVFLSFDEPDNRWERTSLTFRFLTLLVFHRYRSTVTALVGLSVVRWNTSHRKFEQNTPDQEMDHRECVWMVHWYRMVCGGVGLKVRDLTGGVFY
jgi:hypothetical protein